MSDQSGLHPAALAIDELLAQCESERVRRSGPGGQRRNKVETGIVLRHRPTGLIAEASERRSQEQNRREAVRRLRIRLAIEHRGAPRKEASRLWKSRCRSGRITIARDHDDFPALLAEALDVIAGCDWVTLVASESLACTHSQLLGLLRREPKSLIHVNARREAAGLHRLK